MEQIFRVEYIVPPLPVSQPTIATATQTSLQQDATPSTTQVICVYSS